VRAAARNPITSDARRPTSLAFAIVVVRDPSEGWKELLYLVPPLTTESNSWLKYRDYLIDPRVTFHYRLSLGGVVGVIA
jgi:hypothetical protein